MFNAWRRRRILRRSALPDTQWQPLLRELPLLHGLAADELQGLRELALLFLHEKSLEPAGGLELTQAMKLRIAVSACLPILHLGLDYYRGWVSVIVYPDSFRVDYQYTDEAGVVHSEPHLRAGEAWQRGPLILSWADVVNASGAEGFNLVIHECAHKLDMLDGVANGLPPLHGGQRVEEWARVFNAAYRDLCQRLEAGWGSAIHPYAGESPAEFFAVASEVFFTAPARLLGVYPEVYRQLCAFYRQDPVARLPAGSAELGGFASSL